MTNINRDETTGKFVGKTESQKIEEQLRELQVKLAEAKKKEQEDAAKAVAEKKNAEAVERKAFVDDVQAKANAYLKEVAENKKIRAELAKKEQEAYQIYKAKLDEFADKYKGYHLTYTVKGDNVEFKIEEVRANSFEEIIKEQKKQLQDLMNWFNF